MRVIILERTNNSNSYYERMVEAMPEDARPRGIEGRGELAAILRGTFSARIEHGLTVLADVREGNGAEHPASVDNIADLTLALHAIAISNGDGFINGAFSVSDPNGRLAKWLDTSSDLYLRRSSHLKAYQKMTVDGHRNVMRGIDVPLGRNGLVGGMKTVHYGIIPDMNSPTGDGCGPKRRLFLKCESHGVYYNPFFNGSRSAGMTEGMRHRESRSGDLGMSIKHLFSFLETRGADPENETLLKVFNDIVGAASEDLGNKHGDSTARLGNEVMIEASDMDGFALK